MLPLFGKDEDPAPPPPPVKNPARPADVAAESGAKVKVGAADSAKPEADSLAEYRKTGVKRTQAKALGGLGRSGLGL